MRMSLHTHKLRYVFQPRFTTFTKSSLCCGGTKAMLIACTGIQTANSNRASEQGGLWSETLRNNSPFQLVNKVGHQLSSILCLTSVVEPPAINVVAEKKSASIDGAAMD